MESSLGRRTRYIVLWTNSLTLEVAAAFQGFKAGLIKPVHILYLVSDLHRGVNGLAKDES